jgi:hypothetical protein
MWLVDAILYIVVHYWSCLAPSDFFIFHILILQSQISK